MGEKKKKIPLRSPPPRYIPVWETRPLLTSFSLFFPSRRNLLRLAVILPAHLGVEEGEGGGGSSFLRLLAPSFSPLPERNLRYTGEWATLCGIPSTLSRGLLAPPTCLPAREEGMGFFSFFSRGQ